MFCEDGLFIFFIVFYWQNIAWTFAVLWDETAEKKTVYNLPLTHLSGLSVPVSGFRQNIMSSCSLISGPGDWARPTTRHHNSLGRTWTCTRQAEPQGTVTLPHRPLEPWTEREKEPAFPEGEKPTPAFTHLADGVFILRVTCFFRTKPNSFLSLTAAAQPQPLAGNPSPASSPCRRGHPGSYLSVCLSAPRHSWGTRMWITSFKVFRSLDRLFSVFTDN